MRMPPMGAKSIPRMKKVGRTVLGVRMGCHAFKRCCLKAVSKSRMRKKRGEKRRKHTCWSPPAAFLLLCIVCRRALPGLEETHFRCDDGARSAQECLFTSAPSVLINPVELFLQHQNHSKPSLSHGRPKQFFSTSNQTSSSSRTTLGKISCTA